ncbi:MAG: tetratricopeptide repeat protein, partial [Candidatus Omnitrophota bacterium]|nr:tetratricopeptide repeat protein [Candidatus Omnitrophota bacterium]
MSFQVMNKKNGFDLHLIWSVPDTKKYVFAFITLFFCLLIIYGNSLNGAWIFDDEPNIVENKYVHVKTLQWESLEKTLYGLEQKSISRPVAYLTFGVNYYFGQLNPFGYHIVNFFIHFFSSIFLFLFIYRTLKLHRLKAEYGSSSYAIALLSTFFWAINPVHVTAVTYIVQRMASLAGMFYIMSMYFYVLGRTDEGLWKKTVFFVLSALLAMLAIGTKENAIMLPVSIYLYDLLLIQVVSRETLFKNLKYFVVPVAIAAAVAMLFFIDVSSFLKLGGYSKWVFSMWERVLTETRVVVYYMSLLLYPVSSRLMLNHDFVISRSLFDPWTTMAAILFILSSLGVAIAGSRKKPLISYCILFFFLNHIVEGSFIPLDLVFEHRNYIPSMLFFVPLAVFAIHVLDYFSHRKVVLLMAAMLISLLLFAQGHTVYMYNYLFKDSYLLWSDNAEKAPNLSGPLNNIGVALSERGLYDEAYKSYEKAYRLNKDDQLLMIALPINNIGYYYFRNKDYETAMSYIKKGLEINPKNSMAWLIFAKTKIHLNNLQGAEKTTRHALMNWPNDAEFRALLSFILIKQGKHENAIKEAWKTLVIDSEFIDVKRAMGEAYRRKGEYERAVSCWEQYSTKYRDLEG